MDRRKRGSDAELRALHHLEKHGLTEITRNFNCRFGEIDLVLLDSDILVFVEVRQRKTANFGDALESVDPNKRQRIVSASSVFLSRHPEYAELPVRYDIIGMTGRWPLATIDWLKNAFEAF